MRPRAVLAAAASALLLAGCSSAATSATSTETTLTVSAASSLTEAFTDIGNAFTAAHPGVQVILNFGGSSALAEQVKAGAPVDVIALASTSTMAEVVEAGYASQPTTFARNALAIVAPAGNPAGITSLADLADPAVRVALCAAEVPCGMAAATLLDRTGVALTPVTLDPDVKSVLARVVAGEVDAGIVYVTDALAAGTDVTTIGIDPAWNVSTEYEVAPVTDGPQPGLSAEFVALVASPAGRQLLLSRGFAAP